MKRVTSTAPGVYLIHEEGQRPVEGVAVYHYYVNRVWACQECGRFSGTTTPDCMHIALAKKERLVTPGSRFQCPAVGS